MTEIIVNNQKSQVLTDAKTLHTLRKQMAIKAKNYFWSPAYRSGRWDGFVNYITEKGGLFETGLLDQVCQKLRDMDRKYTITDNREKFRDINEVSDMGGLEWRTHQQESLHATLNHRVEGIKFIRGILFEATNAGKSLIAAGIYVSFSQKRRGLFLVNSKTLFIQAVSDLQKLMGKDEIGWVSSEKGVVWKRINVCMVQTLGSRMKKDPQLRNELAKQDIVIMDEADEVIGRKDAREVLALCYNAPIRIALTGSALMSKDKNKNQDQLKFFGPVIHRTTNKQLVEAGISSKPNIAFYMGNQTVKIKGDWTAEYEKGVVKNRKRNKKIWRLANKATEKGQVLILFKLHEHAARLMKICPQEMLDKFKIAVIHGKTPNVEGIIQKYNKGKVDILVASMIIRRGKNIPMIRTLVNAAGGDSEANVLQIFGRGLRKKEGEKEEIDFIEFFDIGAYLQRHSKHRLTYYKKQGFEVRELYKKVVTK